MRLSGDINDPDYWRNHFKICPDVFLDGVLMHHVVEADTKQGFVVIEIWKDKKPTFEATGTGIARRLLSGNVAIVDREARAGGVGT